MISGELHRQRDIPGGAVRAVQVERDMRRCRPPARRIALDRRDEALAQHRGSERQPADRQPVENDADREMRNLEVVGERRRRWRGARSRHLDLGKGQRADMHLSGQQRGRRDVEAEIAQGEIGAVAVADLDPFDLHVGTARVPSSPSIATVKSGSLIVCAISRASQALPSCVCSSPKTAARRTATSSPSATPSQRSILAAVLHQKA